MPQQNADTFRKLLLVEEEPSPEHGALLSYVQKRIERSRKKMADNYATWDYNDAVFRSRRLLDKEDRAANAKGQPAKFVVPLTYAQVMTFVAFSVGTMMQNERFYQLKPTGTEDNPLNEPMEAILERDCAKNSWNSFLVQFFLDVGRFSVGCAEVCYEESVRKIRLPQTQQVTSAFGVQTLQSTNDFIDVPVFVGNRVYPISPYRFFPDVDMPLTRFQQGGYCGSEDMFSIGSLRSDQSALFNLDKIPKMLEKDYTERKKRSRIDQMEVMPGGRASADSGDGDAMVKDGSVVVTKICIDIIPKDFKVNDKNVLGEEDFPIRYICWYANDKTIIRFEEAYYLHGMFPYIAAQFLPDQQQVVNEGLADVCDQIQNTITWLINWAVTQKRSSLDGKFLVDPAGVDVKTLESRSPYIFLKRDASQQGVDRYIKQFQTADNTAGYMQDAAQLKELLEQCSGFSAFMQGQSSQGRRSATQDRAVAQGASARGKIILTGVWDSAFLALGRQLIANNRQEMDFETFARIVGQGPHGPAKDITTEDLYGLFHADPLTIATAEDFFIFDATQPAEKGYLAQTMQELWTTIFTNPMIAQMLGYGPEQMRELLGQIYLLRGVAPANLPTPMPLPAPVPPQNVMQMPGAEPNVGGAPSATSVV